jgi:hypothetical protein
MARTIFFITKSLNHGGGADVTARRVPQRFGRMPHIAHAAVER